MTTTKTLKITETEPVPIVKDFSTFTNYIEENNPSLTRKNCFLTRKTLYQIDQLLSNPIPENRPQTAEFFYPHLNLFYHLALQGNLFVRTHKLRLQKTERLHLYEPLTPTEKYFFMLETFWVDVDLGGLLSQPSLLYLIPEAQTIIDYLARTPPGKVISLGDSEDLWGFLKISSYLQYLSFFGLCQITFVDQDNTKKRKYSFVDSVTITDLGGALLPILQYERDLEEWNIPYIQRETEQLVIFPGLTEDQNEEEYEPFFKPFQELFKGELQRTLPRGREHNEGTFVLKVSLRDCWRTIVVSSEHSLEEFHNAIQDAFDFDKDHLYAFFMEGKPWSHNCIYAPECDKGPSAARISIGDLGLHADQQFMYIFDFGDEWQFKVEVLEITREPGPPFPVITEKKGKSPKQYHYPDDCEH